ncbi:hypothetical protein MASR2M18_19580 [Ignavibacteria bacterium]|nr:T9SS type A sorting domain-containing protein [Bacteroidota bacterium]MCZ2131843.1 T9SS type A sorting domain-containing protein [Bacteroidota bacterium]
MKFIILATFTAVFSLGAATLRELPQKPVSFGAPVSSTGAPGERTCAASGCHNTNPVNSGVGELTISIDSTEKGYIPGKSYNVTVSVKEKEHKRFGFQIVALNDAGLNSGELTIIDDKRTQIIRNDLRLQDRIYGTYTYAGTAEFAPGEGKWTLRWTAPQAGERVTLYAAAVIANDDDTDAGDFVLTNSLSVEAASPGSVSEQTLKPAGQPFTEQNGNLLCSFYFENRGDISVELFDMTGREVRHGRHIAEAGEQNCEFPLTGILPGIYMARVTAGNKSFSRTVLITQKGR